MLPIQDATRKISIFKVCAEAGFGASAKWSRNGFALGRYRDVGPQQTLYVPAPLLKTGSNTIEVFELESNVIPTVEFVAEPILDKERYLSAEPTLAVLDAVMAD